MEEEMRYRGRWLIMLVGKCDMVARKPYHKTNSFFYSLLVMLGLI
jgi:hypothetical protein